jgi:hypothetical protein
VALSFACLAAVQNGRHTLSLSDANREIKVRDQFDPLGIIPDDAFMQQI